MAKRILVTGGAGFIGSHLVNRLLSGGHDVIVVDNLCRGSLKNLPDDRDKLEFVNGNIIDFYLMNGLVGVSDVVFHLASMSRVIPSIENPEKCFEDNVHGTEVVARLCSKYKKKLVFSSSREVYGTAMYLPVDENHPLNPENPYGASKLCGEKIIVAYSKCYGLNYAIVRLANVYGEGDFQRIIPTFIERTTKNKSLIIYGGQQIIDFVHVSDIVNILLKASNYSENFTINAGSGKGITALDLSRLVQDIGFGTKNLIIKEKRNGEVDRFIAKIDDAKKLLNWSPTKDLKEELTSLLHSVRKQEIIVNNSFRSYIVHKTDKILKQ